MGWLTSSYHPVQSVIDCRVMRQEVERLTLTTSVVSGSMPMNLYYALPSHRKFGSNEISTDRWRSCKRRGFVSTNTYNRFSRYCIRLLCIVGLSAMQ